jgi:hypothetical protein
MESTMTGRRKRRYAKLHDADRQAIEQAAAKLLDAMRNAKMNLVAFDEQYTALHELGSAMRVALNVINDRPRDYEPPNVAPADPHAGPGPR